MLKLPPQLWLISLASNFACRIFLYQLLEQPWPDVSQSSPKLSLIYSVHCSHQHEANIKEFKEPFSFPFCLSCSWNRLVKKEGSGLIKMRWFIEVPWILCLSINLQVFSLVNGYMKAWVCYSSLLLMRRDGNLRKHQLCIAYRDWFHLWKELQNVVWVTRVKKSAVAVIIIKTVLFSFEL